MVGEEATVKLWRDFLSTAIADWYVNLYSASAAFLAEYEAYKLDPNSVIFTPKAEVLEAFRKAVKG